ncbi:MAG TPA: GTPase HflX, partial [Syntrophales bacterium]
HSTAPKIEKAILVSLDVPTSMNGDAVEELSLLTDTAGAKVMASVVQRRSTIDPASFLSRGKRGQVKDLVAEHEAGLVIFDEDLSPAQSRNLEKELNARVIDRTELILDIFARRARTREAMLQVELAQLEYILPRLTKMWEHFGRLGGGIGTRGPGETQLEVDRRRVRRRIQMLKEKLDGVERERETQRKNRSRFFRAVLVGYTNAGKSTIFNGLTRAGVLAENKLFATLDTTTRALGISGDRRMLLSDTVGFIRKLPHHLVASFHATLVEVREAELIVHVVDASNAHHEDQMRTVEQVLEEIGARDVRRLVILNKVDLITDEATIHVLRGRNPDAEMVAGRTEEGINRLRDRLGRELSLHQSAGKSDVPSRS